MLETTVNNKLKPNIEDSSQENFAPIKTKLSDKYKGIITKEQGQNLNEHIKQMRSEWNNI